MKAGHGLDAAQKLHWGYRESKSLKPDFRRSSANLLKTFLSGLYNLGVCPTVLPIRLRLPQREAGV